MNIYLDNGYLNAAELAADPSWLKVIIGARQIGKTYNVLKYHLDHNIPFILLRRTTEELEMIQSAELNPFKAFEPEYHVGIFRKGKLLVICDYDENGTPADPRGLVLSLPQIAHIRGFSGAAYKAIIYDEFIPEKGVRVLKSEGASLLNAYATIDGNRELPPENKPPVTLWLLANSNDLNSPILEALDLTDDIITMRVKGLEYYHNKKRNLIVQPFSKRIIDQRKSTALMKQVSAEGEFYGMAINNEFSYNRSPLIKAQSIKGYKPLFGYDSKIYAWEGPNSIYICRAPHKIRNYKNSDFDRSCLAADFFWIKRAYDCSLVYFSDHRMLILFQWLFDINY